MRFRLVCQSYREPQAGCGYPFSYGDIKLLTLPRGTLQNDLEKTRDQVFILHGKQNHYSLILWNYSKNIQYI